MASFAGPGLQQAFRFHALEAVRRKRDLEFVLRAFNDVGLKPILFKGWTLTQFYALPALRPYGDFDILVDDNDALTARNVISGLPENLRTLVDLDMRVFQRFLPDRSYAQLAARASTGEVGEGQFRLLAPEDHLRLVCLHQLDHGAWRPLWLCDVAAFIEHLPPNFHWGLCLEGNARLSEGVVALVSLAEQLLSARVPFGTPTKRVPAWFRDAVLRGWASGYRAPPESLHNLRRLEWRQAAKAVAARWPDAVTSTLHLRAPFRGVPRTILQLAELGRRTFHFLCHSWLGRTGKLLSSVERRGLP